MKINQRFNTLTYEEYIDLLSQYQKYTDFNTLGLFRSIVESVKLTLEQKISLRDQVVTVFGKTFEFLQLKDPVTYFDLTTLGQQLTVADKAQLWVNIRLDQQKILKNKKLRHRNFGTYSKHDCGYETCPLNGLMIRQKATAASIYDQPISFCSDKNRYAVREKAAGRKQDRKRVKRLIAGQIDNE